MTQLLFDLVSKSYESDYPAVSELTMVIEPGELVVLLGPSGSGKTTILRLIAGLLQPERGDIQFNGRSILEMPTEKRGAVMVFQQDALFPFMTVFENVAFGLAIQKLTQAEIAKRVRAQLASVQLSGFEEKRPFELSGGQRQRVALARALVVEPKILLLDEPLSQLDPELRVELRQMIQRLQRERHITTVFVTHDQEEAISIADRIGLIINGRLHQIGTPEQIFSHPEDAQVARFFGAKNILHGQKKGHLVETAIGQFQIRSTKIPDGEVLLAIRPEAIEHGKHSENNFSFTLRGKEFLGQLVQYSIEKNEVQLTWQTSPFSQFAEGSTIELNIPCERITIFPVGAYSTV